MDESYAEAHGFAIWMAIVEDVERQDFDGAFEPAMHLTSSEKHLIEARFADVMPKGIDMVLGRRIVIDEAMGIEKRAILAKR